MSDSSKAFREGKRARRNGKFAKDNPYILSLPLFKQWLAGWDEENYELTFVPPAIAIPKEVKYY